MRILLGLIFIVACFMASAAEATGLPLLAVGCEADSVAQHTSDNAVAQTDSGEIHHKGIVGRIIQYFGNSNKEKKNKNFDMSFIGGPSYTNDTNLSIGLMGSGLYHMNGCDENMQPSNVTIYTNTSVIGLVSVGVSGNNFFPEDRYRINYDLRFNYFPSKYWGVGYDECSNDDNETDMKRLMGKADVEFLFRLVKDLYIGPMFSVMLLKAYDIDADKLPLYHGQDLRLHNIGVGVTLQYDTRDNVTNPHRGVYVNLSQMFRPRFMSNDYAFSTTDITVNAYQQLWKGAILAEQVKGEINVGNPSWEMMASIGGSYVMRGYYKGRYRDKNMASAQMELRQKVWRRCGVTLWGGAGTVFHDSASAKHVLPNFGLGFRWEFKKNVNVRLDYGIGKGGERGFIFNVNEAF